MEKTFQLHIDFIFNKVKIISYCKLIYSLEPDDIQNKIKMLIWKNYSLTIKPLCHKC